mmetsp:Transcript_64561/g.74297  ORF Transcript_64561/g.74297 Transcript_64561/m.74297 type:complete len:638 (-) Transcript_64561:8-1921(-)
MKKDHSGRRSHGNDDHVDDFSTSSSIVTSEEETDRRLKERRRKKKKKTHRDDERKRHRHRKRDKKEKTRYRESSSKEKRKKDKQRKTNNKSSSESDDDGSDYSRRRKHSKKERKRKQKRRRKERKKEDNNSEECSTYDRDRRKRGRMILQDDGNSDNPSPLNNSRGQRLAQALHNLLNNKPNFASELPLILIRLAGGTTFDLRGVTDSNISNGLQAVFESLEIFGVKKQESSGNWMFQNPPGATRRDELVILRVIRSLLDDEGLTMDEITNFDNKHGENQSQKRKLQQQPGTRDECLKLDERREMKELTFKLLEKFHSKDSTLGSQLVNLCKTIGEGESVSVDGIPDSDLRSALESLFSLCGLELSEIENNDDDDDESDDEEHDSEGSPPLMGYGLPDSVENDDNVQLKLAMIMSACREGPPKHRVVGPYRKPSTEKEEREVNEIYGAKEEVEDEDEDEGPLLPGAARNVKGPSIPTDVIKAEAKHRELQLKCTAAGIPMPTDGDGREEWMLIPGQHDFLDGIISGQVIKSRGFKNKKSRERVKAVAPIHPAIKAELDAIMQVHQDARGPSLMDDHRSKISEEKKQKLAANNGESEWKWTRDNDLDAGRRVDKDALGMILGGAADNLKTKFKGGFNQ